MLKNHTLVSLQTLENNNGNELGSGTIEISGSELNLLDRSLANERKDHPITAFLRKDKKQSSPLRIKKGLEKTVTPYLQQSTNSTQSHFKHKKIPAKDGKPPYMNQSFNGSSSTFGAPIKQQIASFAKQIPKKPMKPPKNNREKQ